MAGRTSPSPFVGREAELATLLDRLAAVGRGEGGVVLVAGEPGIGKTRLLTELAARARADGWTVLAGRASDAEGMPPYLPVAEALQPYIRASSTATLRAQLGRGAAEVALLLPELHDQWPDLPASPPVSPEYERYRLFESVTDFLLAIARPRGLLLVLDDLQWADHSSLRLLQHLIRRIADAPFLLAGAFRTTEVTPTHPLSDIRADLYRDHRSALLTLTALAAAEVGALIAGITGVPPASPVAEAIPSSWKRSSATSTSRGMI